MKSIIIKIRESDLNEGGRWLLGIYRQQGARLVGPRDGVLYAEINNEDNPDIITVKVEDALSYADRAMLYGIAGLELHPSRWSGERSDYPPHHPIPTREHAEELERRFGNPHRTRQWYVPESLVKRATHEDGAAIINAAGANLRQWLDAGQFRVWHNPDWISQTEAAEAASVPVTAINNAVRTGTLATWEDPDEPNPQRRTRVRRSEVLAHWGKK